MIEMRGRKTRFEKWREYRDFKMFTRFPHGYIRPESGFDTTLRQAKRKARRHGIMPFEDMLAAAAKRSSLPEESFAPYIEHFRKKRRKKERRKRILLCCCAAGALLLASVLPLLICVFAV